MQQHLKAMLLAAGNSSRFGAAKQLLHWQDKSLLQHATDRLLDHQLDLYIVLGAYADQLTEHCTNATVLVNKEWQKGIGHSIALAAKQLQTNDTAVLISLVDQASINTHDIGKLISAWQDHPDRIVCARYEQNPKMQFGPPVIFPQVFFKQLQALDGDHGAKKIIAHELSQNKNTIHWIDMPNAKFDIDTPDDWQQWQSMPQH